MGSRVVTTSLPVRAIVCALALLVGVSARAGAQTHRLLPNAQLGPDQMLESPNGRYTLTNQGDGVLVYAVEGWTLWVRGPFGGPGVLTMQGDGNLVYAVAGQPAWHTSTSGNDGAYLELQDDGNAVVNRPNGSGLVGVTHTVGAQPPEQWLGRNGSLDVGEERVSPNQRYRLRNRPDGSLALIVDGWYPLWQSPPGAPGWVVMQADGNLVLYRDDGSPPWDTHTNGHPGAHLEVHDNGEVVIYAPPWEGGGRLWWTPTANGEPPAPTLTINGVTEGGHVTIRPKQTVIVNVTGSPGLATHWVGLVNLATGQQLGARHYMTGQSEAALSFGPLPESGQVQAFYYEDDPTEGPLQRAASAIVTIPPVSLLVNGAPSGTAVEVHWNQSVFVRVLNHSGEVSDYLQLNRVDGEYDQIVATQFLNGSATTPPADPGEDANLEFNVALEPGALYAVRLFQAGRAEPLVAFQPIVVRRPIPTLTVNGTAATGALTVAQGRTLQVTVSDAPPSVQWVMQLWADGACCQGSGLLGSWTLAPLAAAFPPIPAPIAPGTYRFYLIDVTTNPLGVLPESAAIQVSLPVVRVAGKGATETVLTRPHRTVPVTVQYAADLTDHVRLAPVSNPTQVVDSALIVGTQDLATATLTTPSAAGLLKVALYHMTDPPAWRVDGPQVQHYPYKIALARSGEVAVSGVPLSVQTGTVITAEVAAEGHTTGDRLALYEVGASDVGLGLQHRPLSGSPTSTYNGEPTYQVTFTVTQPGQYEVRFFDGLTLARLQKSALITVSGDPVGGPTSTGTLTINGHGAGELLVIAAAGTVLTAELSGTAARTGEVQVYRASNQQLVQRVPVNGASVVSLQPIEVAGDYWTQWVPTAEQTFLGPALRRNQTGAGVMTFYDTDVIGSVRRITDASGAVVEEHDYQPFGREYPPPAAGAQPAQPVQFAGKEYDAQTELNYSGARYHESLTGRFASSDPITINPLRVVNPQRWNQYAYAVNNPLKYTDPDGLDALLINYTDGAHGFGHVGIMALNPDGSGLYGGFNPVNAGSPRDAGTVKNRSFPAGSVTFGAGGRPTSSSLAALRQQLAALDGKSPQAIRIRHIKTSAAETAALTEYIRTNVNAPRRYVLGLNDCLDFCVRGLRTAGVPAPDPGAVIGGAIPDVYFRSFLLELTIRLAELWAPEVETSYCIQGIDCR